MNGRMSSSLSLTHTHTLSILRGDCVNPLMNKKNTRKHYFDTIPVYCCHFCYHTTHTRTEIFRTHYRLLGLCSWKVVVFGRMRRSETVLKSVDHIMAELWFFFDRRISKTFSTRPSEFYGFIHWNPLPHLYSNRICQWHLSATLCVTRRQCTIDPKVIKTLHRQYFMPDRYIEESKCKTSSQYPSNMFNSIVWQCLFAKNWHFGLSKAIKCWLEKQKQN